MHAGDGGERRPGHDAVDRPADVSSGGIMPPTQLAISNSCRSRTPQHIGELGDIGRDDRIERGVDGCRDHAPVFARDRVQLMAERERIARPFPLHDLAHAPLMVGVDDGPEEADGDGLDAAALQMLAAATTPPRSALDLLAQGADAAMDLDRARARHIGRGILIWVVKARLRGDSRKVSTSGWPALQIRPTGATLPSTSALVETVVPWTIRSSWRGIPPGSAHGLRRRGGRHR